MAKKQREKTQYFDYGLLILVIMLLAFGVVMLYSTSAYNATLRFDDGTYYVRRQLFAAGLGFVALAFLVAIDYKFWMHLSSLLYLGSIALCIMVLFMGSDINGASRWFMINGVSFQPSEVAKVAVILYLSALISKYPHIVKGRENVLKVFIRILPLLGAVAYNNLSTAIIILGIAFGMLFVASREIDVFVGAALIAVVGILGVIFLGAGYRSSRIDAWLNPENYDTGYQTMQALYAIGSGGLFGKGLGESFQKSFVPEAQNDMIFSIICEELGLLGAVCVIILYLLLLWRLLIIAFNARDRFGSFICVGIMIHIALQVILNVGVVTNTIPNTGITLPFISYGGTSVVILLAEMGLALSVSRRIQPK